MLFMLNPQMNVCEPNPNTYGSDFNRLESLTRNFVSMLSLKCDMCYFSLENDVESNIFVTSNKKKINASIKYFVHMVFLKTSVCYFRGPLVILSIILLINLVVNSVIHIPDSRLIFLLFEWALVKTTDKYVLL